ncbi:hypothetical protein EPO15_08555 [bacterium]|nr:MAG: hypothetical protein EPO15_08555 [bacterium]
MDPRERLERLIMGLEQSIPDMKNRLQWIPPDDLEHKYTQKFVATMEEQLAKARLDLEALGKK